MFYKHTYAHYDQARMYLHHDVWLVVRAKIQFRSDAYDITFFS